MKGKAQEAKFSAILYSLGLILSVGLIINGQTLVPTASPNLQTTPQASPTPPQITDPLVKSFVERVSQANSMLNEGQQFLNLVTSEGNVKAEAKFLEALDLSRTLYRESEDEKLLANLQQTGYSKADWQLLIKSNEINSLAWFSNFYRITGNPQQSLNYAINQLKLIREVLSNKEFNSSRAFGQLGEFIRFSESTTAFFIASLLSSDLDKPQESLDYINQATNISQQIQQGSGSFALTAKEKEADILFVAANIYRKLNNRQKSIENLIKSLQINESLPNREKEIAFLYFAIGNEYHSDFDFKNALDWLLKGLSIVEKLGDKESEVTILGILGLIYEDTYNAVKATETWQRKLDVFLSPQYDLSVKKNRRTITDKSVENYANRLSEIQKLLGIANTYKKLKQYEKAIEYYNKALSIARSANQTSEINTVLALIGNLYLEKEDWAKGEIFYQQAAELSRIFSEKRVFASDLSNLAYAKLNAKKLQPALRDAEQSLLIYQSLEPTENLQRGYAANLIYLSRIHNESGNRKLAIFYGKQAVNTIQRERRQLQNLDQESQRGYLKNNEKPYRRLAEWLIAEGRIAEAVQILNLYQDQQFFDFNRDMNSPVRQTILSQNEQEFANRYKTASDKIRQISLQIEDLKRQNDNRPPNEQEKAELQKLDAELNVAANTFTGILDDAKTEFAKPSAENDKVSSVEDVRDMQSALLEFNTTAKQKTAILYTLIGNDKFHALFITPNGEVKKFESPVKADDLNKKILEFYALLQSSVYDPRPLGKELYDIVFKPVAAELKKRNIQTLMWQLDGNLRYIPMSALFDGKKYLAEKYQNVVFTRADKERMTRNVSPNWTGTIFGSSQAQTIDLLGNGDKITFPALPGVVLELQSIFRKDDKDAGIISGEVFPDNQFTKTAFYEAMKKRRPLVHISSHFAFRPGDDSRSFLVLGDGFLTLNEMKKQANLFEGVELLTLSACNTAATQADANGREIDGFAELAQRLGAGAVMATLWQVSDASTPWLMRDFYATREGKTGTTKAEALQKAQLGLLNGTAQIKPLSDIQKGVSISNIKIVVTPDGKPGGDARGAEIVYIAAKDAPLFKKDNKKPYSHPYYWSPFVLYGNWR